MIRSDVDARWLPTLAAAQQNLASPEVAGGLFHRDVSLWSLTPTLHKPLAGVLMAARTLVRERWRRTIEFSVPALAAMVREPAPPDEPVMREGQYRVIASPPGPERVCTGCPAWRGRVFCSMCSGRRIIESIDAFGSPTVLPCNHCEDGLMNCPLCDGSGRCVEALVEYVTDTLTDTRRLYLPGLPAGLADALQQLLCDVPAPPDALRVRLDQVMSEGPYRASAATFEADFLGYAFGETVMAASHSLAALRDMPGVRAVEAETWAVPFVWLRYHARGEDRDVAVACDAAGELRVVLADDAHVREGEGG